MSRYGKLSVWVQVCYWVDGKNQGKKILIREDEDVGEEAAVSIVEGMRAKNESMLIATFEVSL